uniref:Uncharacterized protein n=1 Tax=Megaselia scalaris TaxID=36166 RepID=T1GAA8_MEGSC
MRVRTSEVLSYNVSAWQESGRTGAVSRKTSQNPTPTDTDSGPSDRATPASKNDSESKEETSSNGEKREKSNSDLTDQPKPPSAGASIRDSANKILGLAVKGEWTPVEQEMKKLEKYVANAGEDGNHVPLLGVHDSV